MRTVTRTGTRIAAKRSKPAIRPTSNFKQHGETLKDERKWNEKR